MYLSGIQISHIQIFVCGIIHWLTCFHKWQSHRCLRKIYVRQPQFFFNVMKVSIHIYSWHHGEIKFPFEKVLRRHHDWINRSENLCQKWPASSSFLCVWWNPMYHRFYIYDKTRLGEIWRFVRPTKDVFTWITVREKHDFSTWMYYIWNVLVCYLMMLKQYYLW